ncbi:uncharacterized protein DMAD_09874 [Drosophila madeirensis]|uniref:Uncharacterized protein n=1 Tax=Drosophila madeirensis TaxID=30013 RepID=A0AAU9F8E0_DROMD
MANKAEWSRAAFGGEFDSASSPGERLSPSCCCSSSSTWAADGTLDSLSHIRMHPLGWEPVKLLWFLL